VRNTSENTGYSALGGSANQLGGEVSFNKKSCKWAH